MKTINVSFEDGEIEQIEREKGKRSWRAFILGCAGIRVGDGKREMRNGKL